MSLTGKQARHLRGLGHHLKPTVMIGKDEVTEAIIAATEEALEIHELIKVKLQEGCIGDRKDIAAELAQATGSDIAQILGKNILLYRESEEKKIKLPPAK
jgi:RNA-binding protein